MGRQARRTGSVDVSHPDVTVIAEHDLAVRHVRIPREHDRPRVGKRGGQNERHEHEQNPSRPWCCLLDGGARRVEARAPVDVAGLARSLPLYRAIIRSRFTLNSLVGLHCGYVSAMAIRWAITK